ncbi:MAG: antitoxin VapB family protein [Nanoarchaeota archaeon]
MAVKTITVTEDAYDSFKRLKRADESFSDLFLRMSKKPVTFNDIVGIVKQSPQETEDLKRRIAEIHNRIGERLDRRAEDVRSRLKRID